MFAIDTDTGGTGRSPRTPALGGRLRGSARALAAGFVCTAALAFSAPATAGDPAFGAVLGAGAGAIIGHTVGGSDAAVVGGIIGAATGAVVSQAHRHAAVSVHYRPFPPTYAPPIYAPPPVVYVPPPVYYGAPVRVAPPVYVAPPVVIVPGHRHGYRHHHRNGHRGRWAHPPRHRVDSHRHRPPVFRPSYPR